MSSFLCRKKIVEWEKGTEGKTCENKGKNEKRKYKN